MEGFMDFWKKGWEKRDTYSGTLETRSAGKDER
jgi:hypothetical protein